MAQIGLFPFSVENSTEGKKGRVKNIWVYEKGTKHDEIDLGVPEQEPKNEDLYIVIGAGDIATCAEGFVYSLDQKQDNRKCLGRVLIKKNRAGKLDYAKRR